MKILWFTWKDGSHPAAGGAEKVNEEIAKRLAAKGHEVVFVVAGYAGSQEKTARDGYRIERVGGKWSLYWRAYQRYRRSFAGWADVVVDEVNTMPFFSALYVKEPNVLFFHQLARKVWFYEMTFPLSAIGWLVEPLYLRLLSRTRALAVSESTKKDLMRCGFAEKNITVVSVGDDTPLLQGDPAAVKETPPNVLFVGAMRRMKRAKHAVRAYVHARNAVPELRMTVVGSAKGTYGASVLRMMLEEGAGGRIRYAGVVSDAEKADLMSRATSILVTSVKEGWGLIVTEANRRGTPAIGYDVDGLRDSIRHNSTGVLVPDGDVRAMGDAAVALLKDSSRYAAMCLQARQWGASFTHDRSAESFEHALQGVHTNRS